MVRFFIINKKIEKLNCLVKGMSNRAEMVVS